MQTDTEVIAYAVDLLMRRQHLPEELLVKVFASPLWGEIDRMEPKQAELMRVLRQTYGSLLMNGPFSIVIAHHGEMIGLTDRIKLRPMVAGQRGDVVYISSEEAAMRLVAPKLDRFWCPRGGEPVIARLKSRPNGGQ
jgi:glutamate synthase domain-containing protein 1